MAYRYDSQHLNGIDQLWAVDHDDQRDSPGEPSYGAWYAPCPEGHVYRYVVGASPLAGKTEISRAEAQELHAELVARADRATQLRLRYPSALSQDGQRIVVQY